MLSCNCSVRSVWSLGNFRLWDECIRVGLGDQILILFSTYTGPYQEKSKVDLRQTKTFRKIEADLKQRRRQKQLNPGSIDLRMESYIDKDRAIAVVSGTPKTFILVKDTTKYIKDNLFEGAEDLKGHVMKLRVDMMKSTRKWEHEALTIQVTIEQAEHELKNGDPQVI